MRLLTDFIALGAVLLMVLAGGLLLVVQSHSLEDLWVRFRARVHR